MSPDYLMDLNFKIQSYFQKIENLKAEAFFIKSERKSEPTVFCQFSEEQEEERIIKDPHLRISEEKIAEYMDEKYKEIFEIFEGFATSNGPLFWLRDSESFTQEFY